MSELGHGLIGQTVKSLTSVLRVKVSHVLLLAFLDPRSREKLCSTACAHETSGEELWMHLYFILFGRRIGKSLEMFPSWRSRVAIKNFMLMNGYGKVDSHIIEAETTFGKCCLEKDADSMLPGFCMLVHAAVLKEWQVLRSILRLRWPADPASLPVQHRALLLTSVARSNSLYDLDLLLSMLPGEKFANEEVPDVTEGRMKLTNVKPVHWIFFAGLVEKETPHTVLMSVDQLGKAGLPIISEQVLHRLVHWGMDLFCEALVDGVHKMAAPDIVHDLAHPGPRSRAQILSHEKVRSYSSQQMQRVMSGTLQILC
eukprot:TRINITY_DN54520_c0_g1_i1.p1 TRINITY_DN54520_c0_g1~~TRINITY_DN54520_c0_g1_i1.p1  ORF type:complete len:313 (+),score=46.12 TRINITY_DN54520_c0_g1_i1:54-992(+)